MCYKIIVSDKANKDINRITEYLKEFGYNTDKVINKLNEDIENLSFMPRIHKTLTTSKNPNKEYRRMISGKYSVIYKIDNNKIVILRIFNQKEDYLNSNNFILKEDSQNYIINKRRKINMIKIKKLKKLFGEPKENYTGSIMQEEYELKILDEAVEKLKSGKAKFYTHEEFWNSIREGMKKDYETIQNNVRGKYA